MTDDSNIYYAPLFLMQFTNLKRSEENACQKSASIINLIKNKQMISNIACNFNYSLNLEAMS